MCLSQFVGIVVSGCLLFCRFVYDVVVVVLFGILCYGFVLFVSLLGVVWLIAGCRSACGFVRWVVDCIWWVSNLVFILL